MVTLKVKVIPNSPSNKIVGWEGDYLKIKIAAAPDKGKANEELMRFFSKLLGVKKGQVKIKAGKTSRIKLIEIDNVSKSVVDEVLENQ